MMVRETLMMAAYNGDGQGDAPLAWAGLAENPTSLTWDRDCGCSCFRFSRGAELTGGCSPVSGDVLARRTVTGHFSTRIYQTVHYRGWLTACAKHSMLGNVGNRL